MLSIFSKPLSIQVLYTGGTFGCVGQPLTPLAADDFIPILRQQLMAIAVLDWQVMALDPVLDSSQIHPQHWWTILQQCLTLYRQSTAPIILIHGTDTMAYTAAFLAEALAGSDLQVCITGSMRPLLQQVSSIEPYQVDPQTDALENLQTALQALSSTKAGTYVAFAGQHWPAQTCQKIHSQELLAFTGHHQVGYPTNSNAPLTPLQREDWLNHATARLSALQQTLSEQRISVYYATPQPIWHLLEQLSDLLRRRPAGLILVGYGLGNFPDSPTLQELLQQAQQYGCLVVMTTQVPFGGTKPDYASGTWVTQCGILPSATLTLAAVYVRLVWICATLATVNARRARWMQCFHEDQEISVSPISRSF